MTMVGRRDLPLTRSGQISPLPTLQIDGHPEVYVIGDRS
jgi:NADH dehydrogenase FAD-containing subunit